MDDPSVTEVFQRVREERGIAVACQVRAAVNLYVRGLLTEAEAQERINRALGPDGPITQHRYGADRTEDTVRLHLRVPDSTGKSPVAVGLSLDDVLSDEPAEPLDLPRGWLTEGLPEVDPDQAARKHGGLSGGQAVADGRTGHDE